MSLVNIGTQTNNFKMSQKGILIVSEQIVCSDLNQALTYFL